jgi:hypothetical protein
MIKSSSKNKKKTIPNRKLLVLSVGFSALIIFGFVAYKVFFQDQVTKFSLKAAIVDQLSEHFPNSTFNTTATNLLTNAGFTVSYFNSDKVTVPFYRELVESGYGIIIFRSHSAMRVDEPIVDLFTSEVFDESKYYDYRSAGLLSKAQYLVPLGESTNEYYFAITPNFVEHFGSFPESIVIAMGCSSLNVTGMAQAFIDRGAKAYVGWTNVVLPNDTDYETTKFLEMFLGENRTLATSIAITNPHNYHDPETGMRVISKMDFYPALPSVGNLTISNLIAEAKDSKTLASGNLQLFSSAIAKVNFKRED